MAVGVDFFDGTDGVERERVRANADDGALLYLSMMSKCWLKWTISDTYHIYCGLRAGYDAGRLPEFGMFPPNL